MIDWERLLNQHGIPFLNSGPSTSRDNIYVPCPWCGSADQGSHMGISTNGRGWGCWRNSTHRGKSPARLLAALLKISSSQARNLLGLGAALDSDSDMLTRIKGMIAKEEDMDDNFKFKPITFPNGINPLWGQKGLKSRNREMFYEYLMHDRYYDERDLQNVCLRYGLRYCMDGDFAYRIIFPIRDELGLATWTGRSIVRDQAQRYKTLSWHEEKRKEGLPLARGPITDFLFQENSIKLQPGHALFVLEGPFDAMRLDYAAWLNDRNRNTDRPTRATCLFGKSISDVQVEKLAMLATEYNHKVLLLDPDASMDALRVVEKLRPFGFRTAALPLDEDQDAADMDLKSLRSFIDSET